MANAPVLKDKFLAYPYLMAEARIFEILRHRKRVVRSIESSSLDGTVLVDDIDGFSIDRTTRTFQLAQAAVNKQQVRVVGFDVKCVNRFHNASGTRWQIIAGQEQLQHLDFFLVLFMEAPDMCAILPKKYIFSSEREKKKGEKKLQYMISWNEKNPVYRLTIATKDTPCVEQIPPTLVPFMLPIADLGDALDRVARCARENSKFTNPYWQYEYDWIPGAVLVSSLISPSLVSSIRRIRWLQEQLQSTAGRTKLELLDVQPYLGDFSLIHHTNTGPKSFVVEHKFGNWSGTPESLRHTSRRPGGGISAKYTFHPDAQFDFFLSEGRANEKKDHQAFFIPRDKIPSHWWVTPQNKDEITVRADQRDGLREFFVDYRDPDWIRNVQHIIERYPTKQELPNRNLATFMAIYGDEGKEDKRGDGVGDEDGDEAGDGEATGPGKSRELYMLKDLHFRLNHECSRKRKGVFLHVGQRHPFGHWFFVRYTWSAEQVDAFQTSGKMPITMECGTVDAAQVGIWVHSLALKRPALQEQPRSNTIWRLFARRPNISIMYDTSLDLGSPTVNYYFVPSKCLLDNDKTKPWKQLGRRQQPDPFPGYTMTLPINHPRLVNPEPFWRVSDCKLVDTMYDFLDIYRAQDSENKPKATSFTWSGFDNSVLDNALLGTAREGALEMAAEFRKYG